MLARIEDKGDRGLNNMQHPEINSLNVLMIFGLRKRYQRARIGKEWSERKQLEEEVLHEAAHFNITEDLIRMDQDVFEMQVKQAGFQEIIDECYHTVEKHIMETNKPN